MNNCQLFGIIGHPVAHSRSPSLHNLAFKRWGLTARYLRLSSSSINDAWRLVRELKLRGFNVTAPYKQEIIKYLDDLSAEASTLMAVNTVVAKGDKFHGFNTDPEGVIQALRMMKINPQGKKILILGAGGAARAAAWALAKLKVSPLWVANRTAEKGQDLARKFGLHFIFAENLTRSNYKFDLIHNFDLIISCLPQTKLLLPLEKIPESTLLLEANYREAETKGLWPPATSTLPNSFSFAYEWLIGQGIKAMEIFTSKKPDENLIKTLRPAVYSPWHPPPNIALIGFMGCGKSTLGRFLAHRLKMNFIDTDKIIEDKTGLKISTIFAQSGESGFRTLEREIITPLLHQAKNSLIALGGGAVLASEIKQILKKRCFSIWLWSPWIECLERAKGNQRPLLASAPSPLKIEELFNQRISIYTQSADLVVPNWSAQLEKTVRLIEDEIHSSFRN